MTKKIVVNHIQKSLYLDLYLKSILLLNFYDSGEVIILYK